MPAPGRGSRLGCFASRLLLPLVVAMSSGTRAIATSRTTKWWLWPLPLAIAAIVVPRSFLDSAQARDLTKRRRARDDEAMRTFVAVVVITLALAGCGKHQPRAADAPEPNRDPYRDVTPAKVKHELEETQKKHEERMDKLQESAR